jgi:hypothetical protein
MARKPASISDCAKSLSYLGPLKDGGYISQADHDRIVSRPGGGTTEQRLVARSLTGNGGIGTGPAGEPR